jgi:excisionase family DNA binding protein
MPIRLPGRAKLLFKEPGLRILLFSDNLDDLEFLGRITHMDIITAQELARYLKLSESTIYHLAALGELPGFKIGDSWRFDMDEIKEMVNKRKNYGNMSSLKESELSRVKGS